MSCIGLSPLLAEGPRETELGRLPLGTDLPDYRLKKYDMINALMQG